MMASKMENPFLPFDIIINILTRLPIKSIVRFQCVCKEWKNLFKTQSFITQHTLHHFAHQNPFLLIHAYDLNNRQLKSLRLLNHNMETTEVLHTHFIDSFRCGWSIVGSSNGLLFIELPTRQAMRRFPLSYLLWNPLSNQVREVPQILNDYYHSSRAGFGYSSVVNDYKIVRFYHSELLKNGIRSDLTEKDEMKYYHLDKVDCVQVYSLSTGSWKELDIGDVRGAKVFTHTASANGTIFWKGLRSDIRILISFDIATEVFTTTPVDTFSTDSDIEEYGLCPPLMFEHGNKLAMCSANNVEVEDPNIYNINMWVVEEGAGESGKSYFCTEKYRFGPISRCLKAMCIWRNEIVCRYEGDDERKYLHLFNLTAEEWNKFLNVSCGHEFCPIGIFNYEKSLNPFLQHMADQPGPDVRVEVNVFDPAVRRNLIGLE